MCDIDIYGLQIHSNSAKRMRRFSFVVDEVGTAGWLPDIPHQSWVVFLSPSC